MTTSLMVHNSVLYVHFGEHPYLGNAQRCLLAPEEQVYPNALRRVGGRRFVMNVAYSTLKFQY